MPKQEILYNDPDRKVNDEKAIADTKEYCDRNFKPGYFDDVLVPALEHPEVDLKAIELQLGMFCGIEGYCVAALFRKYRLNDWRVLCKKDGFDTDEEGFERKPIGEDRVDFSDLMDELEAIGIHVVAVGF